jgi:aminoglycoside phosphotransferase family enzyme
MKLIMRENGEVYRLHKEVKKNFLDYTFEGRKHKAEEE